MYHLIYVSSATWEMNDAELEFLLQQSRDRNRRQLITGMLLYITGNFIQVLEGAQDDVEAIYADIVADDRNTGNIVLTRETIPARDFPNWTMGFKCLDQSHCNELPGFTDFLSQRYSPQQLAKMNVVTKLLYQFKETNL